MPARSRIPTELTAPLDAIGKALAGISSDQDVDAHQQSLYRALDAGLQAAVALARRKQQTSWTRPLEASFTEIVAFNLRNLRLEAEWTQQQLAEAMTAIGFTWARETVVEVERTGRKVQLEEIVGIAALFGVPMVELLLPDDKTALEMPGTSLNRPQLTEFTLGQGGVIGEGGPEWVASTRVLGQDQTVDRPAPDLWRNRRKSRGSSTRPSRAQKGRS